VGEEDDATVIGIIEGLQEQCLKIEALKASSTSALNKRALAIAATELETSMLWLANARPD
jgi:hypothetical protein